MRRMWLGLSGGALVCAALLGTISAWAAGPQTVVGTLLDIRVADESAAQPQKEFDLRIDQAQTKGSGLRPGQVVTVRYETAQIPPGVETGIGDQVQVQMEPLESREGGLWKVVAAMVRLGRGELVRPGDRPIADMGSPEAKVLIKLLAPMGPECHQRTLRLLTELAEAEPKRVRVQVFDISKPAGRAESDRERLHCATVLVNNRYEFTVPGPNGPRRVVLSQRPNEPRSTYNSEDVVTVAKQEIARLYGAQPPKGNK